MATFSLTLRFCGICTHFRYGVAAGVPHRVVLPDTTAIRTGFVSIGDVPQTMNAPIFYYITPHFPAFKLDPETRT